VEPGRRGARNPEVTDAVDRGDAQIAQGQVIEARPFYFAAAIAGDAEAAIRLAVTYDPNFLRRVGLSKKIRADQKMADYWYAWAGQ
jgi:hypothetical protein